MKQAIKNSLFQPKKILVFICFCIVFSGALSFHGVKAFALAGSDFQAGHIIDDSVFTNSGAMTVQQIQNFLNNEVGTCDTYGTQSFTAPNGQTMTHAQWGAEKGDPEPFTCINEYVENPNTLQNNYNSPATAISGGESAAQIIYNAAQAYQINPQVILVTLQKEQGLVTDNWPWANEYEHAMGYACPDTSGCSTTYADFYKQVDGAARQFRNYLSSPGAYNYWIGSNKILYSPASGCTSSTVNIQNAATAALYIYTPYQPDAAALNNVSSTTSGGSGDACSAYGNRNFWWYFTTWFGTTYGQSAAFAGQSGYPAVIQGQSAPVIMCYTNTSSVAWYDDNSIGTAPAWASSLHLAATAPINRSSVFGSSWASPSRPDLNFTAVSSCGGAALGTPNVAQPGQMVEFNFNVTAPNTLSPGSYTENFQPILEGASGWGIGGQAWTVVNVQTANNQAQFAGQSGYPIISQGQTAPVTLCYINDGNEAWYDSTSITSAPAWAYSLHLAATAPINRSSVFGSSWASPSRPDLNFTAVSSCGGAALGTPNVAQPGQMVEFNFNVTAPNTLSPGSYTENFQPILEGASGWGIGGQAWTVVTVTGQAGYSGQSGYPTIVQGQSASAFVRYTNDSSTPWYDSNSASAAGANPVHLAATAPINRSSVFGSTWVSPSRPDIEFTHVYESDGVTLAANQNVVQPGEIAEFDFTMSAPSNLAPGTYTENFQPILEGSSQWDMGGQAWTVVTVQSANNQAQFAGQSGYPTIAPGGSASTLLRYKNNGNTTWYDSNSASAAGANPVHLAATAPINRSSVFGSTWVSPSRPDIEFTHVYESDGVTLAANQNVVQPGEIAEFDFTMSAPSNLAPGTYTENFQPILEGSSQWDMGGQAWTVVTVS